MEYSIEISFNIEKQKNVTYMKAKLTDIAKAYSGYNIYAIHDIQGTRHGNVDRNHCIISVTFCDNNIKNCVKFIKQIKKLRNYTIESIYKSSGTYKLLYASSVYLKSLSKEQSVEYTKEKSTKTYTHNEYLLLNELFSQSLLKDILDIASKSWSMPYPNTV